MPIACAPNFRDLGGHRSRFGGSIREGMLFRAEAIHDPEGEDARRLATFGIRLVGDLRSSREVATAAGYWRNSAVEVLAMDVVADFRARDDPLRSMREDPGEAGALRMMIDTYEALPAACAPHLATLFRRLAAGDGPLLLHCTAGKDRTGFVVALLLHALGVGTEEIMADYLRSGLCHNRQVLAATRHILAQALGREIDGAVLDIVTAVRPAFLEASLGRITRDHGSVDAYLANAAGLNEAHRKAMLHHLLDREEAQA